MKMINRTLPNQESQRLIRHAPTSRSDVSDSAIDKQLDRFLQELGQIIAENMNVKLKSEGVAQGEVQNGAQGAAQGGGGATTQGFGRHA